MIKHFTLISILLFSLTGWSQAQEDNIKYKVDSNIKETVDKQTRSTNDVALGQMEIKMFENDSLIIDTYGNDKKLEFFTIYPNKNY